MNEEKIIAILRSVGCVTHREIPSPFHLSKLFGLHWEVAKRWHRILSAMPNRPVPDDILARMSEEYYEIDKTRKNKYGKPVIPELGPTKDLYGFPGVAEQSMQEE